MNIMILVVNGAFIILTLIAAASTAVLNKNFKLTNQQPNIVATTRKPLFGIPPAYENAVYDPDYAYPYYYDENGYAYYQNLNKKESIIKSDSDIQLKNVKSEIDIQLKNMDDIDTITETTLPPSNTSEMEKNSNKQAEITNNHSGVLKEGIDPPNAQHSTLFGLNDGGDESQGFIVNDQFPTSLSMNVNEGGASFYNNQQKFVIGEQYKTQQSYGYPEHKAMKDCTNVDHAQYYCINLRDGLYFDPWNALCGFIQCTNGKTQRKTCSTYTWMGTSTLLRFSISDMCRRRLPRALSIGKRDECQQNTDFDMCGQSDSTTASVHQMLEPVNL